MPPPRRSGVTHTSKGRGSSSHAGPSSPVRATMATSSSAQGTMENSEQLEQADEEEEEDEAVSKTSAERVQAILHELDTKPAPLTFNGSDTKLKSLRSEWAGMENNFEIAFQVITQVAERFAESLAAEGLSEEDKNLQDLDERIRSMIDLRESTKLKRQALEEIRREVTEGNPVTDAVGSYKDKVQKLEEKYDAKTSKQKYSHADERNYKDYRSAVWSALREDEMPPLVDLIAAEEGDDGGDNDDDDVIAYGGDRAQYKCPLSLQIMIHPLKSTVCQHAFEKSAILEFLGTASKNCPGGCSNKISKTKLKEDAAFTKACQKFARREAMRKESSRTQGQATMLD